MPSSRQKLFPILFKTNAFQKRLYLCKLRYEVLTASYTERWILAPVVVLFPWAHHVTISAFLWAMYITVSGLVVHAEIGSQLFSPIFGPFSRAYHFMFPIALRRTEFLRKAIKIKKLTNVNN